MDTENHRLLLAFYCTGRYESLLANTDKTTDEMMCAKTILSANESVATAGCLRLTGHIRNLDGAAIVSMRHR